MKGFRFYLEYPSRAEKNKATVKKPGNHEGNVVAVILEEDGRGWNPLWFRCPPAWCCEAIVALYDDPNSEVCGGQVGSVYLSQRCKRIPERLAREIHPKLFEYLEA